MDNCGTSLTVFFEDPFWIGDSKKGKKSTEVNDFAFPDTVDTVVKCHGIFLSANEVPAKFKTEKFID